MSLLTPRYEHDCERCRFLGTVAAPNRGADGVADLYVCVDVGQTMGPSVVVRYSDDGPDYSSIPRQFITATGDKLLLAAAALSEV